MAFKVNPRMASQLVQPALLQARQPAIDPQGTHTESFRKVPEMQSHIVPNIVKLLAVSQMVQTVADAHRKLPIGHRSHVEGEDR